MPNQALVVRAFYESQEKVQAAQEQLENIGVWNDWVKADKADPHPFKLIYIDSSLNLAKTSLRRIQQKPALIQVFDPQDNIQEGWSEFKTITL